MAAPTDTPAATAPAARPKAEPGPTFTSFFGQIDEGRFAANATEELEVLVRELRALGAIVGMKPKGKITLSIAIEALPSGLMDVTGDIKLAMPRRPKTRSTFWTTKQNMLSAVNPAQLEMPGLDVSSGGRGDVRIVD